MPKAKYSQSPSQTPKLDHMSQVHFCPAPACACCSSSTAPSAARAARSCSPAFARPEDTMSLTGFLTLRLLRASTPYWLRSTRRIATACNVLMFFRPTNIRSTSYGPCRFLGVTSLGGGTLVYSAMPHRVHSFSSRRAPEPKAGFLSRRVPHRQCLQHDRLRPDIEAIEWAFA